MKQPRLPTLRGRCPLFRGGCDQGVLIGSCPNRPVCTKLLQGYQPDWIQTGIPGRVDTVTPSGLRDSPTPLTDDTDRTETGKPDYTNAGD